jgi:alanine racemase
MKTCWVEIDLKQIRNNLKCVRKLISIDKKVILVIKSNSYGHGLVEVAKTLSPMEPAYFAVVDINEAKKVTIAPAKEGITIKANPIIFKNGLLGRAVAKNDLVALGGSATRRRTLSSNQSTDDFNSIINLFSVS